MLCQCPKGAVNAVYAQNYNELANLILQAQSHRENLLRLPLDVHPFGPFVFTHSNPNSVGCPFSFPTFDSDRDGKVIVRQVAVQGKHVSPVLRPETAPWARFSSEPASCVVCSPVPQHLPLLPTAHHIGQA